LSQRQLAADFGVSQAWISRVEQGHQKTWIAQVFRLAVYLGIEMTAQVGGTVAEKTEHQAEDDYPNLNDLI
jgi:transcriptional regulator with XRE-family HTH domain